jgi:T-complex protein 1 subunit delta
VKKVGGTIDDTELVDGVLLHQNVITQAGGPTRIEKAKIAIIQFQLSPPKPDVRLPLSHRAKPEGLTFPKTTTDG